MKVYQNNIKLALNIKQKFRVCAEDFVQRKILSAQSLSKFCLIGYFHLIISDLGQIVIQIVFLGIGHFYQAIYKAAEMGTERHDLLYLRYCRSCEREIKSGFQINRIS